MTVVDDYQAQTAALASSTATKVAGIYAALQSAQVDTTAAALLVAAAVNLANAAATTIADVFVTAQIEAVLAAPVPPRGLLAPDDSTRLTTAAHTILRGPQPAAEMRLQRMAHAEPLQAAQRAAVAAAVAQPAVRGWVRQFDADPCQLCVWWSRGGRVWPAEHPFQSHPGCNCQPKIVVAQHIQSTEYTRRIERNAL